MIAGRKTQALLAGQANRPHIEVFLAGIAPENLTGAIKEFAPTHLLIIDCCDLGSPPGSVEIKEPQDLSGGASFSTHALPISMLADYLCNMLGCRASVIAIQPASCQYGKKPSAAVKRAAEHVAREILAAFSQ